MFLLREEYLRQLYSHQSAGARGAAGDGDFLCWLFAVRTQSRIERFRQIETVVDNFLTEKGLNYEHLEEIIRRF